MDIEQTDTVAQIRAAIEADEIAQARELLRPALQNAPTAETYYLAALAAVDDGQKEHFLEQSLALDPFYAESAEALHQLQNRIESEEPQVQPITPTNQAVQWLKQNTPQRNLAIVIGIVLIGVLVFLMIDSAEQERVRLKVAMLPTPTPTIQIQSFTFNVERRMTTSILLNAGDVVDVRASGRIELSPLWSFQVGPDGADEVDALFVSSYSIVSDYRHGSLMYSTTNADRWYYCGATCSFSMLPTATSDYLEFEVNYNDQGNNSGHFTVNVTVTRKR